MARRNEITVTLGVRFRWWVWPYLWAAQIFAFVMQPFVEEEDVERLVANVARTVAEHGTIFQVR